MDGIVARQRAVAAFEVGQRLRPGHRPDPRPRRRSCGVLGAAAHGLVRLCESRNIILLIFTDATAHQAASWLGNGATSVMPHAQMAAMVPLTLRALKQRELLTQARRNTALKSEHEARLNLLLKRSSMALAYLSDTHFLSVSDGWAHWLGASTDNLVNQPWIEALPEQLRGDFQGLVTRAQLGDGVEAQVVYNQLPRILRVEPATHAGRECLMATMTAPSTKAAVSVNDRVSDGGIQRTIDALQSRLEQGQAQCLVVLEVKSVASLRHALSLVDFAELMGLVQAKMAQQFEQPPEPINDHTFLVSVASETASAQAQGQQLIQSLQAAPLAQSLPMVEAALAVTEIQPEDQDVTAILQQSYDLAGRLNPGEIEVQSNGSARESTGPHRGPGRSAQSRSMRIAVSAAGRAVCNRRRILRGFDPA